MPDSPTGHSAPNTAAGAPEPATNPVADWDANSADVIAKLDEDLAERLEVDPSRGDVKG